MSRIAKSFVWTASLALLAGGAHAAVPEATEQPYKVILTRNVFNLKPPPPPPPDIPPDTGPPPNIKLTGIVALNKDDKKAMFVITPVGKAEPVYLTVNEGQNSEGMLLKVVEIDEQLGSVKIVMNGTTSTLDFEKNGIKSAVVPVAAANPAGLPSIPGSAGGAIRFPVTPSGGSVPGQPFNKTPAPGSPPVPPLQPIPTRSLRVPISQPQSQLGPAVPEIPVSADVSATLKGVDEIINKERINNKQYPPALIIH